MRRSSLRRVSIASLLSLAAACGGDAESAAPRGAGVSAAPAELRVGDVAPDFRAHDQHGNAVASSALRGKHVVLYFYPKDETSGCTAEAEAFRDAYQALTNAGAVVIGVSTDSDESHRAFAQSHGLPFTLISDASETLAAKFGVPVRLGFASRQTFVIAPDGRVKRIYRDVDVAGHAAQIMGDVR